MQLIKVPFFTLLHSRTTQVIFLIWPMVIFNEVLSGIGQAEPLSMYSANSIDALNFVAFDVFSVFGAFVVALWSWFICSRDKSFNIAELVAAAPISNRQIIGGQIIALGLLISVLVVLTFIGSSLAELAAGSDWLFSHYIVQLGLTALPLFLLGTLFICIHHLCRSSAVAGGLVIVILLVKFSAIMTALGLTHTLWNIADSPIQEPDNFWGYRASLSVYLPYMSVWLIAATSMVLLASNRSHRGTSLGKLSLTGLPKHVLSSFVVTVVAGLGLHFALVSEKPLTNSDKRETWKAQYETQFGNWQHKAQPSIVHIDSNVDIFPAQQFAKFSLSYTLENRTTSPINKILVGRYGNYAFGSYSIKQQDQKDATLIEFNSALNQGVFQLSRTLMPGEQTTMQTEFTYEQSQLWPHRSHQVVTPEFSYLRATPLLPTVGFQTEYLLTNAQIRDHYNLPQLEAQAPSKQINKDNSHAGKYNWASLNTVISTQLNHQPISQGTLVRSWQKNQRTFVHYQTKHPVNAIPTWLSVPFTALSKTVQGTTLNVYSPSKNQATEINLKAMADTMAWLNQNVSPYTGAQLNLIAAPDIGAHSFSVPHIMLLNHTIGFRAKPTADAEFDQRYRRMVSETARQWFAHDLGNGVNNERSFFVESMPKYIELVMIEKQFGTKAMLALVEYEQNRFNLGQTNSYQNPVALIDATQKFDIESRATLAFAKLRETLGDEPIIAALKSLWLHHAYPQTPATSMDFIRALQRHSPKTHYTLINELFLSPITQPILSITQ